MVLRSDHVVRFKCHVSNDEPYFEFLGCRSLFILCLDAVSRSCDKSESVFDTPHERYIKTHKAMESDLAVESVIMKVRSRGGIVPSPPSQRCLKLRDVTRWSQDRLKLKELKLSFHNELRGGKYDARPEEAKKRRHGKDKDGKPVRATGGKPERSKKKEPEHESITLTLSVWYENSRNQSGRWVSTHQRFLIAVGTWLKVKRELIDGCEH